MAGRLIGLDGNEINSDSNENLYVRGGHQKTFGTVGGGYVVAGWSTAVVAAGLAANTTLVAARVGTASPTNIYITRLRFVMTPATLGAAAGVAGILNWQKFGSATPTGGNARTPARKDPSTGSGTQLSDVRDSNAALTVTSVTFSDIFAATVNPLFVASAGWFEWIVDLDDLDDVPIRLTAGDGICLRNPIAMAATQTWMYAYTMHYYEAA